MAECQRCNCEYLRVKAGEAFKCPICSFQNVAAKKQPKLVPHPPVEEFPDPLADEAKEDYSAEEDSFE